MKANHLFLAATLAVAVASPLVSVSELAGPQTTFTLGSYIVGGQDLLADPSNSNFQHEYGHYIQSQLCGPLYLFAIAAPSLISATTNKHEKLWMEKDASTRAFNYFIGNGLSYSWKISAHPIYSKTLHYWQNKLGRKLNLYY